MSRRHKVELPRPALNITAMMDLVLNLVMFFVLVSNFAAASLPPLDVPQPDGSLAQASEGANRVTVSLRPPEGDHDSGKVEKIMVGVDEFPASDLNKLRELLRQQVKISKNVEIDLRADKTLEYSEVAPIMLAIRDVGVTKVNLVALPRN